MWRSSDGYPRGPCNWRWKQRAHVRADGGSHSFCAAWALQGGGWIRLVGYEVLRMRDARARRAACQ